MIPAKTTVNGRPAAWGEDISKLWLAKVAVKFDEGETCSTANYYTPRPWQNEYDRGSDKEGFVYVVQPGYRVCQWERIRK
jgi:hypothetical protein